MNGRLPSLSGLRAFEAAARHLSVTLAAGELNVTPGAVSLQIRELEQSLGVSLFERRPRQIRLTEDGEDRSVRVVAPGSGAANPAFDVTPARLVTGLVTERGVCAASAEGLAHLFPDLANGATA